MIFIRPTKHALLIVLDPLCCILAVIVRGSIKKKFLWFRAELGQGGVSSDGGIVIEILRGSLSPFFLGFLFLLLNAEVGQGGVSSGGGVVIDILRGSLSAFFLGFRFLLFDAELGQGGVSSDGGVVIEILRGSLPAFFLDFVSVDSLNLLTFDFVTVYFVKPGVLMPEGLTWWGDEIEVGIKTRLCDTGHDFLTLIFLT